MIKPLSICLILMISIVCNAQTGKFLNNESSKLLFKPLSFNTYYEFKNNQIPKSNYTFKNRILLSPFNIYHDSLYIKNYYMNPFYNKANKTFLMSNRYYYDVNNPLAPFGKCFECAIVEGSLNYLFLLFSKEK